MVSKQTKRDFLIFFRKNKFYILAISLCFSVLLATRLYVNHFTTGDEPHYLLMEYSLEHDQDLNLKNNYVNKDYWRFYPEYVPPHVSHLNIDKASSGWYSFHGVGLPIMIFPAYLIAEKSGPAIFMVFIATIVTVLTYVWSFIVTKNKKASILAGVALVSCYFFNGLAGYLYPDLVIAALTLTAFIIISTNLYTKKQYQLILGLSLGAMVFLHFRTLALVLPVALVFLYMHKKRYGLKVPWVFLIPSFFLAITFFFTLHRWFGVWEPNAIYSSNVGVSIKNLVNTPAILFDSLRGSFVYNPILFVIPIGLPLWYKYSKRTFRFLLLLLPIVYVIFGFNEWHGGFSPNGRYLMGLLPVLMPAIVMFCIYSKSLFNRALLGILLVATFSISLIATLIKQPYTGYALRSEVFISIEKFTLIGFDKMFPRYNFIDNSITDKYGLLQAYFWMIVLVLLCIYGIVLAKRKDFR